MEVLAIDIASDEIIESIDSVDIHNFGLNVLFGFDFEQVARISLPDLGIGKLNAMYCESDVYAIADTIESVQVFCKDYKLIEFADISDQFISYYTYYDQSIAYNYDIDSCASCFEGIRMDLIDFDGIPESAIFRVDVKFTSDTKLSNFTPRINFFN